MFYRSAASVCIILVYVSCYSEQRKKILLLKTSFGKESEWRKEILSEWFLEEKGNVKYRWDKKKI